MKRTWDGASRNHIQENFEIFDFELTDEEMQEMTALDRNEICCLLRTADAVCGAENAEIQDILMRRPDTPWWIS